MYDVNIFKFSCPILSSSSSLSCSLFSSLTMFTLGAATPKEVIGRELALSDADRKRGVEVGDEGILHTVQSSQGGHGQCAASEADLAGRLTGVVQDAGPQVDTPSVRSHLGVADLEPVNVKTTKNLHKLVESWHLVPKEVLHLIKDDLYALPLLPDPQKVVFVTEQVSESPQVPTIRHRVPCPPSIKQVRCFSACQLQFAYCSDHYSSLVPERQPSCYTQNLTLQLMEGILGPAGPAAVAYLSTSTAEDIKVWYFARPETALAAGGPLGPQHYCDPW